MADAVDETEKLFARASAAIAEAARLAEESYICRKSVCEGIRLMRYQASFYPKSVKIYSPMDFLLRLGPGEPHPKQSDSNGKVEDGKFTSDPREDSSD